MDKALVSIGLITYNQEKYVADTLESLISQDYERMELVILDDASDDETVAVIERYMVRLEKRFERIVRIYNEKNSGNIPLNCNCMIRESEGDYYFEVAGDDILLPSAVCVLYEAFQTHPDCAVVHSNMIEVREAYKFGDEIYTANSNWKNRRSGVEEKNLFWRLMNGNCIAAPTVMVRREIFEKYGYHDENIPYEDYEYWLRISRTERFYFENYIVVLHRLASSSISNFEGEKVYEKLKVGINADFLVKKKYIEYLDRQEQVICWRNFYSYYFRLCTQKQFQYGLDWLKEKMEELNIDISECQISYKELFEKKKKDEEILGKWLVLKNTPHFLGDYLRGRGIYHVAIYGYLRLGNVLQRELLNDGIAIDYIIDRQGAMLNCPFKVYTMEESLPKTDAIIVAPPGLYESVRHSLQKKDITVLDLCHVIEVEEKESGITGRI